jgi:hypothetical protein
MPLKLSLGQLAAAVLCTLLTACSAKYVATKVKPEQVRVTTPGIYYSLPRTELLVVVGVKKTTKKSGIYGGDAWEDCVKECVEKDSSRAGSCPAEASKPKFSYELTSVKSYSRAIADPGHLYHVKLDLKAFAAFTHTFKLSNEGILTSSSSEIENKGVEVAINSAKAVLGLVGAAKGGLPKPPDESSDPGAKPKPKPCKAFLEDYAAQRQLDEDIQTRRDAMDRILFTTPAPEGPAIEQLIKRHEARISELKASPTYEKLTEHRGESSKEEAIGDFAVMIKPDEFMAAGASEDQWKAIQQIDAEGFAGLELKPGKQSEINGVAKELENIKLRVKVTPTFGFGQQNADLPELAVPTTTPTEAKKAAAPDVVCNSDAVPTDSTPSAAPERPVFDDKEKLKIGKAETGYRYRFPAAGQVTVSREFKEKEETKDKDGKVIVKENCWRDDIANFRTLVAQYGAVTAMPPKITGVKSKIMLDLYESTGSPRQVDVGATPMPSTVVGDALAPVQAEIERRNQERKDKKAKAENAATDELTKERDLLKLQKEIAELKKAIESGGSKDEEEEEEESEEPAAN